MKSPSPMKICKNAELIVGNRVLLQFFRYMLYDFDVSIEGWFEKPLNDASWQRIQITKSGIAQGVQSVSKYFWIFS